MFTEMAMRGIHIARKFPLKRYAQLVQTENNATASAPCTGDWKVITSTDDNPLCLSLAENDMVLIHQGNETYECIFLINSKEWIRGFHKGDSFLIVCRFNEDKERRFRIQFEKFGDKSASEQCQRCVNMLCEHFPFRDPSEMTVLTTQPSMSKNNIYDQMYAQSFEMQETLEEFVRLCLQDPMFSQFVAQVGKAMDTVLNDSASQQPS
ncbi:uncharacterized protein LOC135394180 isoform X1 [Ornithodoros turicata]|uniref:uncharacterized protein LOC135394180 isoform X1 n=1 Tax=Ornithodoros turicata TaxID=34597 RepID=UPI003139D110